MAKIRYNLSVYFVFSFIVHCGAFNFVDNNDPYRHEEILNEKIQLEWQVNFKKEIVTFNLTAKTNGYVGFGLSKKGEIEGADIVIGGVDSSGRAYFTDRHGTINGFPAVDKSQDWVLHSAWENSTHTFLSFSRSFDTCDTQDMPINDDVRTLIWAIGDTDKPTNYKFEGNFPVYLRDPDLTPRIVQNSYRTANPKEVGDVKLWTVKSRFRIPAKKTTYWCNFHKINLPTKHHIIGYSTHINSESKSNMHHLLLFRCIPPPNVNPESIFEPFLRHPGVECYSPTEPLGVLPTQYCVDLSYGHAIGGLPLFHPDHVGIPIGRSPTEYYLLQTHYDNPESNGNITSDIQIDVFYTPKLRKHDAGIISIGANIPGSPSILLPPKSLNHRLHAHCSPSCTQQMLPSTGIKIVSALLHSHNTGRQVRIQHFRGNRELRWISNDDNYIVTYQPTRTFRNEVTILPGDQVTMRCVYDSTDTNTTTVGGFATDQEMCKTFAVYYNRLEEYVLCRSEIIAPEYMQKYLGITNVTWDQSQLELIATSPPQVAGLTISQVSDSSVNWTTALRADLQRDHIYYPQVSICPKIGPPSLMSSVNSEQQNDTPPPPQNPQMPNFVSYPSQSIEYRPIQRCSLRVKG